MHSILDLAPPLGRVKVCTDVLRPLVAAGGAGLKISLLSNCLSELGHLWLRVPCVCMNAIGRYCLMSTEGIKLRTLTKLLHCFLFLRRLVWYADRSIIIIIIHLL